MLARVFSLGTIFEDVLVEVPGGVSFGRQMGTYPLLIGIPKEIPAGTPLKTAVVSYSQ